MTIHSIKKGMEQYNYFHQQVQAIVEANLENRKFNVKNLSVKLGISRSQLYRKIKKTSGLSVAAFIRKVRLDTSKELLKNTDWTIATIAKKVGFQSSSYFTHSFTKVFGHSPKQERR